MPKGFTEREKELIQKQLFAEGSKLFNQFGVQKTTVDEIAKAVGISKGSFYLFYNSKEELFFDILESLDKETKEKFSSDLFPQGVSYRESFRKFLNEIFDTIQNTAILQKLNQAEMEQLFRKLPADKVAAHLKKDNSYFEDFYITLNIKGILKDADPKAFSGILKLLFFFVLNKSNYASDEFLATKEFLICMLCEYLVT